MLNSIPRMEPIITLGLVMIGPAVCPGVHWHIHTRTQLFYIYIDIAFHCKPFSYVDSFVTVFKFIIFNNNLNTILFLLNELYNVINFQIYLICTTFTMKQFLLVMIYMSINNKQINLYSIPWKLNQSVSNVFSIGS